MTSDPGDNPNLKRRAAKEARWTTLSSLGNVVLQLVQIAILARLLLKEDFGVMGMAWVFIAFAILFEDAGLTLAVVHKQKSSREQLSTLFWTNWAVGLGLCAVLQMCTPLVVAWNAEAARPELLADVFRTTALFFAISPLGQLFMALMWRDLKFRSIAVVELGSVTAGLLASVAGALLGWGVFALVAGHLGRTVTYVALAVLMGRSTFWPRLHWRSSDLRGYLNFGLFQMADRVSLYGVRNLDKLFIGRWFGDLGMGLYMQAWHLMFRLVTAINPILTRVTTALFAKIQHDDVRLNRGFLQLVQLQTLIMAPVGMGLIAVAPALIPAYLGPGWEDAIVLLRCLAGLVLFFSLRNGCGSVFTAKGRPDLAFRLNLAAAVLALPAIFIGQKWGMPGIALGLVVSQALVLPYQLWILKHLIGMKVAAWLQSVVPLLLCSMAMCVAVLGTAEVWHGSWLDGAAPSSGGTLYATATVVVLVLTGGLVYGGLVVLVRRDFALEMVRLVRWR